MTDAYETLQGIDDTAEGADNGPSMLAQFVMNSADAARNHRDSQFIGRFGEYYRLWRGIWNSADSERKSERSRLITPALQQAIESISAEIDSAFNSMDRFFDLSASKLAGSEDEAAVAALRDTLAEDFEEVDASESLSDSVFIMTLWGTTGIKAVVESREVREITPGMGGQPVVSAKSRKFVSFVPVIPQELLVDPTATSPRTARFLAHEYDKDIADILSEQGAGRYLRTKTDFVEASSPTEIDGEETPRKSDGTTQFIEYHGKVPGAYFDDFINSNSGEDFEDILGEAGVELPALGSQDSYRDMREVVIHLAYDTGEILLAEPVPTLTGIRSMSAARFEVVPNQFWGRGAGEKGYNSQKALDGQMRARQDGLALTVHPMMALDGTGLPRNFNFAVRPGRNVRFPGGIPLAERFKRIDMGTIDPQIFTSIADLERMVSMSTGSVDTAAPTTVNNRNETADGMGMMLSGFIKRAARTVVRVEKELVKPMVTVALDLYMQLDPIRYPASGARFKAFGKAGIMARELEATKMGNMLKTMPTNSVGYWIIMRSIYEVSNVANRDKMLAIIDDQIEKAQQPPEDPFAALRQEEIKASIAAKQGQVKSQMAAIQVQFIRAQAEVARASVEIQNADDKAAKLQAETILALARAEAEEVGHQLNQYRALAESMAAAQDRTPTIPSLNVMNGIANGQFEGTQAGLGDVQPPRLENLPEGLGSSGPVPGGTTPGV